MELAHRWSDRNLTRNELIIALLILALLIGFFSRYVLVLFARAEESMINSTVISINSGLYYRAALAVMRRDYRELKFMEEMNPMEDLKPIAKIENLHGSVNGIPIAMMGTNSKQANYGGEINAYTIDSMKKGNWYFHQGKRQLIYVISNSELFTSETKGLPMIRFKIVIDYEDKNTNGLYEPEIDEFRTMKLRSLDHYQWNY